MPRKASSTRATIYLYIKPENRNFIRAYAAKKEMGYSAVVDHVLDRLRSQHPEIKVSTTITQQGRTRKTLTSSMRPKRGRPPSKVKTGMTLSSLLPKLRKLGLSREQINRLG